MKKKLYSKYICCIESILDREMIWKSCLMWIFFAGFLYYYLSFFKNALIDDAFITLSYVRTILRSGTWGFFPEYVTNTASSPLNVLFLTLIGLFTGPTIEIPILSATLVFTFIAITLTRISLHLFSTKIYGYLATFGLVFNPLLISTIGLESILFTGLFVFAIYSYLKSKWHFLAVTLGLLTITRIEGVLFLVVFLMSTKSIKLQLRIGMIYLLCISPWFAFSWIHLGSFIPDTFFIKTAQASWGGWDYFNGLRLYYNRFPVETILSFAFFPTILLLFRKTTRNVRILLILILAGMSHFIGYSILEVPPYHWYYVPQVITVVVLGCLNLGIVIRAYQINSWQRNSLRVLVLICFLVPALGMLHILVRDGFYLKEMPIHTNWATHAQYKEIGLWLKERNYEATVLYGSEIGTLAYYCDCFLLDVFSDRRWLKYQVLKYSDQKGVRPFLYRLNFLFYLNNQNYPPCSSILTGFMDRNNVDTGLRYWETSSKWVPEGLVTIQTYP